MDAVLLDTDVFSYLTRAHDTRGDAYPRRAYSVFLVGLSFWRPAQRISLDKMVYFGREIWFAGPEKRV
jgi:hypothetical protein